MNKRKGRAIGVYDPRGFEKDGILQKFEKVIKNTKVMIFWKNGNKFICVIL